MECNIIESIVEFDGECFKTFGISCKEIIIKDISTKKAFVEGLINLINKNDVSKIHILDIIEDILV